MAQDHARQPPARSPGDRRSAETAGGRRHPAAPPEHVGHAPLLFVGLHDVGVLIHLDRLLRREVVHAAAATVPWRVAGTALAAPLRPRASNWELKGGSRKNGTSLLMHGECTVSVLGGGSYRGTPPGWWGCFETPLVRGSNARWSARGRFEQEEPVQAQDEPPNDVRPQPRKAEPPLRSPPHPQRPSTRSPSAQRADGLDQERVLLPVPPRQPQQAAARPSGPRQGPASRSIPQSGR